MKLRTRLLLALAVSVPSSAVLACASCGCSLSSEWESQGLSSGPGLRFDLRYDYLNQNQVRSGTGKVSNWPLDGHEQEVSTANKYFTASVDYSWNSNWGVNLQLPYIDRTHVTNLDGTGTGTSHSQSLGDVKVIGRYTGFSDAHDSGVQFGVKLPTGSYTESFSGGDVAGQALDRGLQPGTGTTDLILGAFTFGAVSQNWDYFAQAMAQLPTNSRDDYKPGNSLNVNVGFRYLGLDTLVPQIQVPVYQNLNGYQLAPKYTVSVGTHFEF